MRAYLKTLDDQNKIYELTDFLTIGKDSICQIHIMDDSIADRHARIESKSNLFCIKDLRSNNGTYVNETQIQEAILKSGDLIRLGKSEFVFLEESALTSKVALQSRNETWNAELQTLAHVAKTNFPVLLLGPSGTGKDILAQALHENSLRQHGPFISVNCSALTETLIESELFGHIRGSFTGAINDRKGAFEAARGGTLFLDEIGDLPNGLQAKLLRALENSEIRPVGSDKTIRTDVRILAATHQNLYNKIQQGEFRSDLFYRLNVVSIHPPSLKDRMEDFEDILFQFAKQLRVRFSHGAILKLKKYSWPGNIRELKNLVARAKAFFPYDYINEDLIEKLIHKSISPVESTQWEEPNMPVIKEIEKQMIIKRLKANGGNQRRTANDLGMPKSTLHDRLKHYNIDPNDFKV